MMKKFWSWTLFLTSLSAYSANFELGTLVYGGSGCGAESIQILESEPAGKFLRVFPRQYIVGEAQRKTCLLALPVRKLENGYKIAVSEVRVTLKEQIEEGGSVGIGTELFTPGTRGKTLNWGQVSVGQKTEAIRFKPNEEELAWFGCGQGDATNLRMNMNAWSKGRAGLQVEQIKVKIRVVPC